MCELHARAFFWPLKNSETTRRDATCVPSRLTRPTASRLWHSPTKAHCRGSALESFVEAGFKLVLHAASAAVLGSETTEPPKPSDVLVCGVAATWPYVAEFALPLNVS